MTLYLYKTGTTVPVLTLEGVETYTADSVTVVDAQGERLVYAPLAEDCELSSAPDCSETLRADWREEHPTQQERMETMETVVAEIETLMAALLFGGEGV